MTKTKPACARTNHLHDREGEGEIEGERGGGEETGRQAGRRADRLTDRQRATCGEAGR